MCCSGKELLVDAICEVSVRVASGSVSVPHTETVATVHRQKLNGVPCQEVEIGVMMDVLS